MCGIVGVVSQTHEPVSPNLLKRMTDVMAHRGPDGEGQYIDGPVGLGHRRLAIIDLSPAGHQPMANQSGDIVVVYNGEIYNFQELRVELEAQGHRFHSRTDTEVIIHGYEQWGEKCVDRFNGMFAFAVYDRPKRRLFLVRDRLGIKPLYWWYRNGLLVFASEIKAILLHPRVSAEVCYPALYEYFTFQNIFTDRTLFEGIRLLPAGCSMSVDLAGGPPRQARYWDYEYHEPFEAPDEGHADAVHEAFVEAVTRQLVSDVPVGAYLSGGMDSGSITAVAARHLPRMTTFTCGFDLSSASGLELSFDERATAETMANEFKTEHYEVVLHAGDMEHVLPRMIWHLEDLRVGQCYPNFYAAGLASKFVKVVLSGAGGDELFGGYPWRYYRGFHSNGREEYLRRYYDFWQRLVPDGDAKDIFNDEAGRRIGDLSTFDVFHDVMDNWDGPFETNEDYLNASLYFEIKTFLHGLLVVEDKLSMAHSLETRVPFLDNQLVDLAMRVPATQKVRNLDSVERIDENLPGRRRSVEVQTNDGKAVLRRAMARLIPAEILERRKQGFSAPDASWFRGESIDYINHLLRDPKARIYDYLRRGFVTRTLDVHCSGKRNERLLIWSLLCFEWWLKVFLGD